MVILPFYADVYENEATKVIAFKSFTIFQCSGKAAYVYIFEIVRLYFS